jgi:Transmembrane secretion effector
MRYSPPRHGFRTFLVLWATQSLSVIGSGMTGFVLNVYLAQTLYPAAHQKAELAFAFTALNLASAIPFIFGGPVAGAWTDRLDRRMILLIANAASGVLTLGMLILMLVGALNVWALVGIGILGSTVGAFHFAAFDASYAMLVPDRLLARANGMMWTTWYDVDHLVSRRHRFAGAGRLHPGVAGARPTGLGSFWASRPHHRCDAPGDCHRYRNVRGRSVSAVLPGRPLTHAQRSRGERLRKAEPVGGYSRRRTLYLGPAASALATRHIHGRQPRRRSRRGARTSACEIRPGG